MITTIRRAGNSFVIRIPREELERIGVQTGDPVLVTLQPVDIRPRLSADLAAVADARLAQPATAAAFKRLADA